MTKTIDEETNHINLLEKANMESKIKISNMNIKIAEEKSDLESVPSGDDSEFHRRPRMGSQVAT